MSNENSTVTGFTFWPVGTGDSSTVKVAEETYFQIDIRHMDKAEDGDDPAYPIIDHLEEILPKQSGKPYLSTFALTHPDKDHCQGFEELLKRVTIGELWLSPRTFREYKDDLCEDAQAFQKEALRRVEETIKAGGDPGAGNRIRIIGYDYLLKEQTYQGFPTEFFSVPGHSVTLLDGNDYEGTFCAFIHAPFLDDSYGDRNDCSLAFQITLTNGEAVGKALYFGDLTYPILKRIFAVSEAENLEWNILLAPHHCSKSAMYWKDEGEEDESLKSDILDIMQEHALEPGYIIASSAPIPASNEPGDNPPHVKAKREYLKIVPDDFICTHEHPNESNPVPVVFAVTNAGFEYLGSDDDQSVSLSEAIDQAEGNKEAPAVAVGYGSREE